MSLVWTFNVRYDQGLFLQVIWAIGVSMIVLAVLVHLQLRYIAVFSVVIICGHNLLDAVEPQSLGAWAPLWSLLHVSGPIPHAFVAYPLIPWIAVMSLGYCLGALFEAEAQKRKQWFIYLGAASLTAFESARGRLSEVLRTFGRVPLVRRSKAAARRLVAVVSIERMLTAAST